MNGEQRPKVGKVDGGQKGACSQNYPPSTFRRLHSNCAPKTIAEPPQSVRVPLNAQDKKKTNNKVARLENLVRTKGLERQKPWSRYLKNESADRRSSNKPLSYRLNPRQSSIPLVRVSRREPQATDFFVFHMSLLRNENTKKDEQHMLLVLKTLCGQRDSNPHASRHQILSLTWLPITPCPQGSYSIFHEDAAKVKTFYQIHNIIFTFSCL